MLMSRTAKPSCLPDHIEISQLQWRNNLEISESNICGADVGLAIECIFPEKGLYIDGKIIGITVAKEKKMDKVFCAQFSGATHFSQGNIHAHISTLEMTFLTAKHELLSQLGITVTRAQTK